MFYYNYVALCNKHNISPSAAAEAMGMKRSVVTAWKNGRGVRQATLQKVADYFGVTVEDLLRDEEKPTTPEGDGLDRVILAFLHRLPAERLRGILIALDAPEELLAMLDREDARE